MYFSHSNDNKNYTKAVSLSNVRSVYIDENKNTKSAIRYSVNICYTDAGREAFNYLDGDEAETVYNKIVKELNKI